MPKTKLPVDENWTRRTFVKTSALAGAAAWLPWAQSPVASAQSSSQDFDFYISPTGSDGNSGTMASPWAITALNTKRATYAGKRVGLLDGTYSTASIAAYAGGYSPALGVAPGSSGSPTIIESVNPRMAILDDSGSSFARGIIGAIDSTAGHFTLRNLKVRGARQGCIHIQCTSGRGVGIKVDGCEVYDQRFGGPDITTGIFLQALDDAEVTNCYIHDITNTTGGSRVAGIMMYGCRRTKIERCSFASTVNAAIHDKYAGGSPRTDQQETQVRQCYFAGNPIALWGFDNKDQTGPPPSNPPYGPYIIENNVFDNCGAVLSNPGAFSAASPVIFRNNTIYAISGTREGLNLHTWMAGCEPSFYNNIWHFSGASWGETRALVVSVSGSGGALANVIDYNCYGPGAFQWLTQTGYGYPYTPNSGSGYAVRSTPAAWQSATGRDQTGRSLFATNALFTMTGSGADRFKLQSGSPCIGAGRVGGVPTGATRNMGAWDGVVTQIGCHFGPTPRSPVGISVA
jgi:hypothetical protein